MQGVKARKVKSIVLVSTHFIFPKTQLRNQNKHEKEPGTRKRYKETISRAITGVTGISAVEWSMEIPLLLKFMLFLEHFSGKDEIFKRFD